MKANPKKLGGRKGDRMTPDWLDRYVVVGLTDHQVVLRNTKTNKILKSISLAHIKPFRDRAVDSKVGGDVKGEKVEGFGAEDEDVGDVVKGFRDMGEDVQEESEDDGAGGEVAHGCGKVDCVKDTGGCKVVAEELIIGDDKFAGVVVPKTFAGEVERLKKLRGEDVHLDCGPAKLKTKDIWSIIPPQEISKCEYKTLKTAHPEFTPGWLSDMVSWVAKN